jgi:hypothetical protein
MIFILVDPTVAFLCLNHKLVITKTSIDKCIDECSSKVTTRRIHCRGRSFPTSTLSVIEERGMNERQQ